MNKQQRRYRVEGLPRDYSQVEIFLRDRSFNNEVIYISTAFDFIVLEEKQKMDTKKRKFIVRETPNSSKKLEILLNEYADNGFQILHMNDYSVVFVRDDN